MLILKDNPDYPIQLLYQQVCMHSEASRFTQTKLSQIMQLT